MNNDTVTLGSGLEIQKDSIQVKKVDEEVEDKDFKPGYSGTVAAIVTEHDYILQPIVNNRDSLLVERQTRDRIVANSNPGGSGGRLFFQSQLCVVTLIRCPFNPRVTAVARKNNQQPSHSAKSAGGRLHVNMHTPLTQLS